MWVERYPYIQQQIVLPDTLSTEAFQFHEINFTNNLTHMPTKEGWYEKITFFIIIEWSLTSIMNVFVTLLALSDNLTTQIDNLSSQKGRKFTNYHTSRNLIQGKLCATRSHHLLILIDRFWFQPNPSYTHYALTRTNFWLKLRKFWSENWPKMTFHKSSQLIAQSIQDIKTSWLSTIWHQIDEFSTRKPKKTSRKSYFPYFIVTYH